MAVLAYLSLVGVLLSLGICSQSENSWKTVGLLSRVQGISMDQQQSNLDGNAGKAGLLDNWDEPGEDTEYQMYADALSASLQETTRRMKRPQKYVQQTTGRAQSGRRKRPRDDLQQTSGRIKRPRDDLQQTTLRMKRPRTWRIERPQNQCTEKGSCKDSADKACCWVPGSSDQKMCIKEVPISTNKKYYYTRKTTNRLTMLQNIRSEMDEWLLYSHGSFQVVVLPVGQGDCITMQCPNGKIVMFDCGSTDQQNTGGRTRALSAEEVRDHIVEKEKVTIFISHGDMDHYNYLDTIFSNLNKIENVIIGGHPNEYTQIHKWIQAIARSGKLYAINNFQRCIGACNDKLHTINEQWTSSSQMTSLTDMDICGTSDSPVSFDILAANVGNDRYKNQKSIVLKVTAGTRSVLFTGDMEGSAATTITRTGGMPNRLQSNVFHISHHGASRIANRLVWLQAISPEEASVSHAYMGQNHHPRCNVIQRLISIGSIVTDTQFFPNTHPFYCARSHGGNNYSAHNGETCHRIFNTHPRHNTMCVALFTVGNDAQTSYNCYTV